MKSPQIIIALILVLLLGCTTSESLEGFYYTNQSSESGDRPLLFKFENDLLIKYTVDYPLDTFNVIPAKSNSHYDWLIEDQAAIIKTKDTLSFYNLYNSSLLYKVYKQQSSNYIFESLNDHRFEIELPINEGKLAPFSSANHFEIPLYAAEIDNELHIHLRDTTMKVDSRLYQKLWNFSLHEPRFWRFGNRITIVADKQLKISQLRILREQLSISGSIRHNFALATHAYNEFNLFSTSISPLSSKKKEQYMLLDSNFREIHPPPPPIKLDLKEEDALIIFAQEGAIFLEKEPIDLIDLQRRIEQILKNNNQAIICLYMTNKSTLQDYMNLIIPIRNTYYDLRDEYLMAKHQITYRASRNNDERSREAIEKYPMRYIELDSSEFASKKVNRY